MRGIAGIDWKVGAEVANVITVTGRLLTVSGKFRRRGVIQAYLSDDAGGDDLIATAPDGGVAAGAKGKILVEDVADKLLTVQSDGDGAFELAITHAAGAKTLYVVGIVPDGTLKIAKAVFAV